MALRPLLEDLASIRLTTAAPNDLARFYCDGLGFKIVRVAEIHSTEVALLGLGGAGQRTTLRLGEQQIDLDQFEQAGRPYPENVSAADLCFQHFAIVTDDVAFWWRRVCDHGAVPISRGPITLPRATGGVTAVKFRDPEGHPLELIQFPNDGRSRWKGTGILGIDHTAIAVRDAFESARFYAALGLLPQLPSYNIGVEQDVLDGIAGVIADVIPLIPALPYPHLELLGYRQPKERLPFASHVGDIVTTRTVWRASHDALIRDPDGHCHQLQSDI